MPVCPVGCDSSARRALDEAALQQVWLVYVLDGVACLSQGHGDGADADGTAIELVDYEPEIVPVSPVEAELVHALHVERGVGRLLVDLALAHHLGVVSYPLEEPVHDTRRAAAAAGELARAALGDRHVEYARVAGYYLLQFLGAVVLQPLRDAEAVEQGFRKQALPGRRADQRELRQVYPDGAGRRPLAEHDVHREVLHRGVEDLFDLPVEAVDLFYEQEVTLFERGQNSRHVPGFLQRRPARRPDADAQLLVEDAAQRGLAETGRTVEQYVVERLTALLGRLNEDLEVLLERLLPDELVERAGPERRLIVPDVGLGIERVLPELSDTGGTGDVLERLLAPSVILDGEVVHLLSAQRLLPIRRNASFMYFSTETCGGTSLSAFSASSRLYPSAVSASLASM